MLDGVLGAASGGAGTGSLQIPDDHPLAAQAATQTWLWEVAKGWETVSAALHRSGPGCVGQFEHQQAHWEGQSRNLLLHSHPPVVTEVRVGQRAHRSVPQESPPGDLVAALGDCAVRLPGNTFQFGCGLRVGLQDAPLDVLKPDGPGNACIGCQFAVSFCQLKDAWQ